MKQNLEEYLILEKLCKEVKEKISLQFFGGYCDDDSTKATIKKLFED